MERWTLTERQRIRQQVERVLHVPGNYTGGILEMALVLDCRLSGEERQAEAAELCRTLKQQSEVFRNVRLNLVLWQPGERLQSRVVPMPVLMMGAPSDAPPKAEGELYADELLAYLKVFQARAKLVFVLSAGQVRIGDRQACGSALKPFLGRKLIWLTKGEEPVLEPFLSASRCGYLRLSSRDGES